MYDKGSITIAEDMSPVDFDFEVSYADMWRSCNDFVHYRAAADGFGQTSQTFRRIEINSSFYAGSYTVNTVPDSTKRSISFYVRGSTFEDLSNARDAMIDWFTQADFVARVTRDETKEYWQCECADYQVDESHVYMHNKMCKLTFTITVMPYVNTYVVF